MTADTSREIHAFQAEVSELLKLVIGSLYSHPEIFLRELVSNASDAIDRLRFRSITEPDLLEGDPTLEIRIVPDEKEGTLTIEDTGAGMTKEELVENLGTIARSGTKAFVEKMKQAGKDGVSLIGQFGVGFYSAFLVADRVDVTSRAAGAKEAFRWSSDAKGEFSVEPAEKKERGTTIVLHLKAEQKELLDSWRLRELVRRYSDYVGHPIKLREDDGPGKAPRWEVVNRASALWQRSPNEVKKEEYEELYKHLTHDLEPPLAWTHFRIEGTLLFAGILYIPKKPPFDPMIGRQKRGVRLYVKRVFILEDAEELVPPWLRFVRGVVDSDDLPLNVSRELLQDSSVVRTIKKQLVKRTLDRLDDLARESEADYATFWKAFGPVLKEGIAVDADNRDRLAKLARFATTKGDVVSLEQYVARMPLAQPAIYYAIGESKDALAESPHLEGLRKKGYEVLLLTDPVDEWAVDALGKFDGKPLVSAMRADIDLGGAEAETKHEVGELADLCKRIKNILGDKIADVRVSRRLTDSPACLVLPQGAHHAPMEQLLRAAGRGFPAAKRIFELNPDHPLVQHLKRASEKPSEAAPEFAEWVETLYDQALLLESGRLDDPAKFARRVTSLLEAATRGA